MASCFLRSIHTRLEARYKQKNDVSGHFGLCKPTPNLVYSVPIDFELIMLLLVGMRARSGGDCLLFVASLNVFFFLDFAANLLLCNAPLPLIQNAVERAS